MILLDTHALIWMDTGDRRLGRKSRTMIEKQWESSAVGVSAISFWEVGLLCTRGRLRLASPLNDWRNEWLLSGLIEIPLDGGIAARALDLTGISDDPADRFIAATAIALGATLLTADQMLLDWRHSLIRIDART